MKELNNRETSRGVPISLKLTTKQDKESKELPSLNIKINSAFSKNQFLIDPYQIVNKENLINNYNSSVLSSGSLSNRVKNRYF
jgi:hypothetical protein